MLLESIGYLEAATSPGPDLKRRLVKLQRLHLPA